jgi:hypothetical protein
MKRLLIALFCVSLLASPVVLTTGCKTSGQTLVYNTLYSVQNTTLTAYDTYLDQVVKGKIGLEGVPSVSQAFNRFQIGMQVALSAAQFNWQAPAPVDVTALASQVLSAIVAAKGGK